MPLFWLATVIPAPFVKAFEMEFDILKVPAVTVLAPPIPPAPPTPPVAPLPTPPAPDVGL